MLYRCTRDVSPYCPLVHITLSLESQTVSLISISFIHFIWHVNFPPSVSLLSPLAQNSSILVVTPKTTTQKWCSLSIFNRQTCCHKSGSLQTADKKSLQTYWIVQCTCKPDSSVHCLFAFVPVCFPVLDHVSYFQLLQHNLTLHIASYGWHPTTACNIRQQNKQNIGTKSVLQWSRISAYHAAPNTTTQMCTYE